MRRWQQSFRTNLIASRFDVFVRYAFRVVHGVKLGDQPYVEHMCHEISHLIEGERTRLLINLPPQHLKSFVCTICLAAYLLGRNPRLRILLVAYNDDFAEALCSKIRDLMQSDWYRQAFATRIKEGHARANDFATVEGGGIFAVGATGAVTGRTADLVIYDDPHEIGDWNNDRKLEIVRNNFNTLLSRLHDKVTGRVLVAAHRVSENDLSAFLMAESGWKLLRLPLVANRTREFDLGHDVWVREKGDVLRPDAYPAREIERLQRSQVAPPFQLFYQQGLGSGAKKIRADHFQSYAPYETPIGPVVLSIDPSHDGGSRGSRAAMQAWKKHGSSYYLLDEFCESCDVEKLRQEFWRFVRRYNPALALVERTADGPALRTLVQRKTRFEVRLVTPRQSKGDRLDRHLAKIRGRQIYLPVDSIWRDPFINEIINFPGEFDDRVDAMTQYLDFTRTGQVLSLPPPRTTSLVTLSSARWRWQ
jgi:predicted phage terminase large subunit-like protein